MALTQAQQLGVYGEQVARRHLIKRGYKTIETNARNTCGEIDIIAVAPNKDLAFIEVKTRSSFSFGAAEAVTTQKYSRMRAAATRVGNEWPIYWRRTI